jgi:recombination protein RecA
MPSAAALRLQIEAALANRIPSALTPAPRVICPTAPTGIPALDDALSGGLPIGAITELAGPECSGRTSLALSFIAGLTHAGRVCAWIDVSDTLHPESAAAIGVDLDRLLWIRCGPQPQQLTFPDFAEDRHENPPENSPVMPSSRKNVSAAVTIAPPGRQDCAARCAEPVPKIRQHAREVLPSPPAVRHRGPFFLSSELCALSPAKHPVRKPWSRMDQALRATDLLLQAGGFSAIVLDMASIAPEFALRVPLATWFRYRAAAERTHASVLLLTQHACTKSSAGLVLHCQPSQIDPDSTTVLTGANHRVEITRERFAKVVDFDRRKPPQSDHSILWQSRTPWSAARPLAPEKAARK